MDRTTIPWHIWLLRYMATDDESAFEDLIWSVGGSPPYGDISYEEAGAVYDLLQEFRGVAPSQRRPSIQCGACLPLHLSG